MMRGSVMGMRVAHTGFLPRAAWPILSVVRGSEAVLGAASNMCPVWSTVLRATCVSRRKRAGAACEREVTWLTLCQGCT